MASSKPLPGRCGAKIKGGRERYCTLHPVVPTDRCRHHQRRPIQESAQYRNGQSIFRNPTRDGALADHVPKRLLERVESIRGNKNLLSLKEHMILADAFVTDRLESLGELPGSQQWSEINRAMQDYKAVKGGRNRDQEYVAWQRLENLIDAGVNENDAWSDIFKVSDIRRKLVGEETKQMVSMRQMIPADKVLAAFQALVTAAEEIFSDSPSGLRMFRNRVMFLMSVPERSEILGDDSGEADERTDS